MSENYDLEKDLKEAEAMAKALVPYVHRDELYGSVGASGFFSGGGMPSLTLGALLMRMRRLNVLSDQLDEKQIARLQKVEQRYQEVLDEWRVHCENKLAHEINSRLDAMRTFFEECQSDPRLCARVYRPEALRRTISQEIVIAMEEMGIAIEQSLKTKLSSTDSQLRRYLERTSFIWDAMLEPVYPEKPFWWLYQRPPVPQT